MALLATLRTVAKTMGIPARDIRSATTAEELASVIDGFSGNASGNSKPRKKATKKAVAKRGAARKSVRSKSAPAARKSQRGEAKRPTTATARSNKNRGNGNSGRNMLDSVDFSPHDGWNPREGSAPDRIVKALRKFRGNRDKVFDFLVDDVWDFVGKKKADGSKRSKDDALDMLAYRISRTAWEFAVRTGQHDPSNNRVEYGTGGTGTGAFQEAQREANQRARKALGGRKTTPTARKPQKRSQSARGASTKRATAKRGTVKRAAVKRAPAKRATAKRTSIKRSTKRRTARR